MSSEVAAPPESARIAWVDRLKGVALLWVFLNHASERLLGGPLINNPFPGWPPFDVRLRQLAPLTGHGLWTLPLNLFRYVGWTGDEGVGVFLLAAGFGLTWSLLGSNAPSWGEFYRRRVLLSYPTWLLLHALVLVAGVLRLFPINANFVLSALGL